MDDLRQALGLVPMLDLFFVVGRIYRDRAFTFVDERFGVASTLRARWLWLEAERGWGQDPNGPDVPAPVKGVPPPVLVECERWPLEHGRH